ncbi:MAG: flavodoxin family protein [Pseudomonadota bacterium]
MKALVLSSSPRADGNSMQLARNAFAGLQDAGHDVSLHDLNATIGSFLNDCRRCRQLDGDCGIVDGFRDLFMDEFLPADGVIVATPIYWYGMSAQLKAFFDRMFCYVAASHPASSQVLSAIQGKRIGLVLSSEETFPTVSSGIVHQMQEFSRYTRSTFVGVVHGHGNARGDVHRDPRNPVQAAYQFGQTLFTSHATDFSIDTPRPSAMWREMTCEGGSDNPASSAKIAS